MAIEEYYSRDSAAGSGNCWFISFYGSEVNYWGRMFPGLVLYGLAMGLTFAPLNSAALSEVPEQVYGRANATFLTGRAVCVLQWV